MIHVCLYLSLVPMGTKFYSQHDQGSAFVTQITVAVSVMATCLWPISVSQLFFWRTSKQDKGVFQTATYSSVFSFRDWKKGARCFLFWGILVVGIHPLQKKENHYPYEQQAETHNCSQIFYTFQQKIKSSDKKTERIKTKCSYGMFLPFLGKSQ